jgi:hypothetical protein
MPDFGSLVPWSTYSTDPVLLLHAEGHRVLECERDTKGLRTQVKNLKSNLGESLCTRSVHNAEHLEVQRKQEQGRHSFLMGINEITMCMYTVKPYDILQVRSTLVKFVYYIMEYIPYAIS